MMPIDLLTIPKDVDELAEEAMDDWYNGIFGHPGEPGVTIWQVRVSPRCLQRGSHPDLPPSPSRKYWHRTRSYPASLPQSSKRLAFKDLPPSPSRKILAPDSLIPGILAPIIQATCI
jgi:hypothetical protein